MILPDDQLRQLLLGAGIIDAATLEEIAVHAKSPHTTLQHALLEPRLGGVFVCIRPD